MATSSMRWIVWTFLAGCGLAHGSAAPVPALDPTDYRSPSGRFSLHVEPNERHGAGPARYSLQRGEEAVWSGELPFTLQEAVVDDLGRVAGYGYSKGSGIQFDPGDFLVAVIAADGTVSALERTPRAASRFMHADADPKAATLFLHPELERVVIRVADPDLNRAQERWWVHAMGDGRRLAIWKPSPKVLSLGGTVWALDARALPGTPLTLVHWMQDRTDSVLAALDAEGNAVWEQVLRGQLAGLGFDSEPRRAMIDDGLRTDPARPGWFSAWHLASAVQVDYLATPADGGSQGGGAWRIEEVARSVRREPAAAPVAAASVEIPVEDLRHLGSIDLRPESEMDESAVPLGPVEDFAPDPRGGLGILHGDACETPGRLRFTEVDVDGAARLERELEFSGLGCRSSLRLAGTPDGSWLLAETGFQSSSRPRIWRIAAEGSPVLVATLPAGRVSTLVGLQDGGFALLYDAGDDSEQPSGLLAFDRTGKLRWSLGEAHGEAQAVFSPEDLALMASGEIAVLQRSGGEVRYFDAAGRFQRGLSLEQIWQRKPNYPSGLAVRPDGGLVVHDFNGTPSVVLMRDSGAVEAGFVPRYADGREVDPVLRVVVDARGRIWISDAHGVLGLDAEGRVERVYGSPPASRRLNQPIGFALAPDGRILVADDRTGFVHVFAADGSAVCIAQADPELDGGRASLPSLSANARGEFLLERDASGFGDAFWVRFGPDCRRLGQVRVALDGTSDGLLDPHGDRGWVLGYMWIARIGADGEVQAKVQHDAKGRWLEDLGSGDVALDGSLALSLLPAHSGRGDTSRIAIYAADASPLQTFDAPEGYSPWHGMLAWDGERLVLPWQPDRQAKPEAVLLSDAQGRQVRRLRPLPGHAIRHFALHRGANGAELWIYDGERRVERYALP